MILDAISWGPFWLALFFFLCTVAVHEWHVRERNRVSRDDPMYTRPDRMPD